MKGHPGFRSQRGYLDSGSFHLARKVILVGGIRTRCRRRGARGQIGSAGSRRFVIRRNGLTVGYSAWAYMEAGDPLTFSVLFSDADGDPFQPEPGDMIHMETDYQGSSAQVEVKS